MKLLTDKNRDFFIKDRENAHNTFRPIEELASKGINKNMVYRTETMRDRRKSKKYVLAER